MPVHKERNLVFRNEGELKFTDVSEAWGIRELTASYGAAVSDLDRDGDLDLLVANFADPVHLYENNSGSGSVAVELRGESNNRLGIGAKVQLQSTRGTQTQVINYLPRIHVGR